MRTVSHTNQTVSTTATPVKDGDWKINLALKFRRNQLYRSPRLENLIGEYIKSPVDKPYPYLGHLIRACMEGEEDRILHDILENENKNMETLTMQGPVGDKGWEIFAKEMPDNLAIKKLVLRDFCFTASEGQHFFDVLGRLHALREVTLTQLSTKSNFFMFVKSPPLELDTLVVAAGFPASLDDDDCLPALKILEACKLRSFSFVDSGGTTADQHRAFGRALAEQVELKSLRLECVVPKDVLYCYRPLLSKNSPLTVLDLSGFKFATSLLEVLAHSKPDLKSLRLTNCHLQPPEGSDCRSQFDHLSSMLKLETLDLSRCMLDDETIVPLLSMIERGMIGLLQHLHLNHNPIGSETIKALVSLFRENRTLVSVKVEHDSFVYEPTMNELLEELVLAVKHNTSLRELTLPGRRSGGVLGEQVEGFLNRNRSAFQAAVAGGVQLGIGVIRHGMSRDVHSEGRALPTEHDPLLDTGSAAANYGSF